MIKKITYCLLLFLLPSFTLLAQTATITGSVKTADGKPADLVSITIKGTNKATLTDENGHYQIKRVTPGSHRLVASFIGLEKREQTIETRSGETLVVNFILKENSTQLQEVVISTKKSNKVNSIVAKMPLKNLENPQVYNTVSSEIIKQQGITSYDDALRNVPGIAKTWGSTGRGGDGGAYFAIRGFQGQATLVNGLSGLTSGDLDLANVEEIQVIKGPSGTLFGGAFLSYGGMINTITKKPYFTTGGEITYNVGSFGLNRVTADVNTPLSKTEKVALRVNAAYTDQNSFQNAGFQKSFFVAPSLIYEVNDKLSFHFLTEIMQEERAVAPIFFPSDRMSPLPFKTVKDLNLNYNESFISNDLTMKNPRFNLQAQMLYKISSQWTSQTVFSRTTVKSNGYYSYIYEDAVPTDQYFGQTLHKDQQTTSTTDVQQNFNGDFKIGNMRNRLLIGLDYYSRNAINNGSGYAMVRRVTPQSGEVAYPVPHTTDTIPPVYLSQALVDNILATKPGNRNNTTNSAYSAYVSDVINFTPALAGMASLRVDHYVSQGLKGDPTANYNQTFLSPKFGLVYQPVMDKVSIFANYMNAFINVDPRSVADSLGNNPGTQSFKPEHANQWEVGVKTNLLSDKLNITVSYYDIRVSDRVYTDPHNINGYLQGGTVGSKGLELDMNANPAPGLNLLAGYSHNSIKVLKGNAGDFYNEPGRTPGGQGPPDLANLWATYKFTRGDLKNFGFGVGGNYASEQKSIDSSVTGIFYLPSYLLINSSLFYSADNYRITLNLNNITNKQYYIGNYSIIPQAQRNFALSFAYKF
ncbi:iron complex outermembrane recepter protein [Mucilaginibacter lappiensis]|uniref:Iron complex outermembrane receptor protein n=1 Tax=Mucilaginibacter lappiensis TaxID=354630 RepID=A0ABR6PGY7_9SPHI|nr:TonB-dependent receptor [Mucilaginibacter lappiensis]MBB6109012.1 iron complex outermembrane receptor protein [Mucilaginibacter lappiensis]SIQ71880.1 iron complex outermembrane recepter protein [Mucilaginibacter lappiensis]